MTPHSTRPRPSKPREARVVNLLIVLRDGEWFVRDLAFTVQDDIHHEMRYTATKHLGGPFRSLLDVAAYLASKGRYDAVCGWPYAGAKVGELRPVRPASGRRKMKGA